MPRRDPLQHRRVIVPVSGGKDSQVVLSMAIARGHSPICVHQNTGYDHPYTYQQLIDMQRFYDVNIEHTKSKTYGDMFGLLAKIKYFPNSAARGCTQRLKQDPFAHWLISCGFNKDNAEIWFGMRQDESKQRADKYGGILPTDRFALSDVSAFYAGKKWGGIGEISCVLPIIDWNTQDVFDQIHREGAPLNKLYARGHTRVGCYPCLLSRKAEWMSAARDKIGREHIQKLIAFEEEWKTGNPRKYLKVHRVWDVRKFLNDAANELIDCNSECGYCSI